MGLKDFRVCPNHVNSGFVTILLRGKFILQKCLISDVKISKYIYTINVLFCSYFEAHLDVGDRPEQLLARKDVVEKSLNTEISLRTRQKN